MKLPISSNALLSLIIRSNMFFTAVVAPNLDPFTPPFTKSYSLWNSPGILDGGFTQNPDSSTSLRPNGNLWPTSLFFSFFQHQPEVSHKEIAIRDSGEDLIEKNMAPQVYERSAFDFPRLSSLDTISGAANNNVETPSQNVERRYYSKVLCTKNQHSDVNTLNHKNRFIPTSHVPSIAEVIQIHEPRRPSESKDTEVSHFENQHHESQERSSSEYENELHDASQNLKTPVQTVEMTERMEDMKKSLEPREKSKLETLGEKDHQMKAIKKSHLGPSSQIIKPVIQQIACLETKRKGHENPESESNESVKEMTIQGIAKGIPQPQKSTYKAIVSRGSNQNIEGHFGEFENENPYQVLDEYFNTNEAHSRGIETDGEKKVNELDSDNDNSSRIWSPSQTKTKSKEEEKVKTKGIAETNVYKESSSSKVPALASHLTRKGPKRGKGKTKKTCKTTEGVYVEKDVQTSSFLTGTPTSPKRCDPELQELISSNNKGTFFKLSKFEFLSRCIKLKNKTEGLKINLSDLGFQYMMVNGYATDPKSWTEHIKMYTSDFGSLMEGKRRLISILEQFKERHIVFSWSNRRDTLSPSVQRIAILLRADQSFPTFANATIEEWTECNEKLLHLIKTDMQEVQELVRIFGYLFHNRVATLCFMAYSHLDKQSIVLKEILEDGSIMQGVHIPAIMCIANILDLSSDAVSWKKLSKEELLEKTCRLIETMNGVVLFPAGHKFQIFDHTWNSEYTMYRLSQKKDRLSELFSVRIKTLASLSDKHDLKLPFEWLEKLPETAVEASLGEALICLHVNLHFDLLEELKAILRSQPRRANTSSRIIGTWTDNLPEHLLMKTPEFKRFFALRDQKVKGLGPV